MSIDAMKQALAVMDTVEPSVEASAPRYYAAREALRAAIEQSPMHYYRCDDQGNLTRSDIHVEQAQPAFQAAQPPCQWQGLTDEDREEILRWVEWKEIGSQPVAPQKLIAYVEEILRDKNT